MQFFGLLSFVLVALSASAHPAPERRSSVGLLDEVLVFDAPAFPDPANPSNTIVQLQSFVAARQIDLGVVASTISATLASLGITVGDKLTNLQQRVKLIGAVGLAGKTITVNIPGCSQVAVLSATSGLPNLGMAQQNISIGQCGTSKEVTASVVLSTLDSRKVTASVFSSPDSGFGVISDIDDTVKVSNVLDTVALLKSTLLDDPVPVAGMPELYASLAQSLNDPQFIYVTGSPFQLYPFLNSFIDSAYSASKGPIFAQNLTLLDIPSLAEFAAGGNIQEFKDSMIDRIKGMYPHKKFLAIGDSTQKDPETYGEAFRKYGDAITCSWIRQVDGANNTAERFAAAFDGVPSNKFRIFTDADIAELAKINVAGGEC